MVAVGELHENAGDTAAAESWYRRGIEAGCAVGVLGLSRVLIGRGQWDEAERMSRASAAAGQFEGMAVLGLLLTNRGDPEEAKYWQERARAVRQ
jgi:hypothetical protein